MPSTMLTLTTVQVCCLFVCLKESERTHTPQMPTAATAEPSEGWSQDFKRVSHVGGRDLPLSRLCVFLGERLQTWPSGSAM